VGGRIAGAVAIPRGISGRSGGIAVGGDSARRRTSQGVEAMLQGAFDRCGPAQLRNHAAPPPTQHARGISSMSEKCTVGKDGREEGEK